MTEKEILKMIKQSAEEIEVPESLSPERILEKCRKLEQQKEGPETEGSPEPEKSTESEKRGKNAEKKFPVRRQVLMAGLSAAVVFIICGISLMGRKEMNDFSSASPADTAAGGAFEESAAEDTEGGMPGDFYEEPAEAPEEEAAAVTEEAEQKAGAADMGSIRKRQDAGELYTLAESYDAVYEHLREQKRLWEDTATGGMSGGIEDLYMETDSLEAAPAAGEAADAMNNYQDDMQKEEAAAEREGYSLTNVQTFGIDESDVIKTDGEYIYALRGSSVSIIKADEDGVNSAGTLEAESESGSAEVCAMYVDGDILVLITQENLTSLEKRQRKEAEDDFSINYMNTETATAVLTYDVRNRSNPVLLGKVTQEGSYVTSRKEGTLVYLFTDKYLTEEYTEEDADVIPEVNEKKIEADCIYVRETGDRALIISSVALRAPDTVRDTVMLLDDGAQVYMGADSLYLYDSNYQNGTECTEIAKFTMNGGYLNGASAVSLKGTIQDTFAINEKDGRLRVLTTDYSGADRENCLFLLDENLKVTGKLEHIAVGESIYAARYLGDMAYFITYRNTDPLFAADLSDETAPKLVGELKITGFSEYLHFWGEDKLLGIGYETDPATGNREGLKLVMFDMSDPAKLKILGTKVLKDVDYSPALYDYKAVLAAPEENLIGFAAESYRNGSECRYELFQWDGSGFENILSENIKDGYNNSSYRGIYIGKRFYIAHPEVIRYYDRTDYRMKQKFEVGREERGS